MWWHLRFGLRQLGRNRLFAGVLILLLAVGIGANTLVFSLIDELLLKPLPVRNPANLYLLEKNRPQQIRPDPDFEYSDFEHVARARTVFGSAVAEQSGTEALPFSAGGGLRLVTGQVVSPNYFSER